MDEVTQQQKVNRLIALNKQAKETRDEMKKLKEELTELTILEEKTFNSWLGESGGTVSVTTIIDYTLAELVPVVKIDESVLTEERANEFIKVTTRLTRKGMKHFRRGDEDLQKLMIPNKKKKVIIA